MIFKEDISIRINADFKETENDAIDLLKDAGAETPFLNLKSLNEGVLLYRAR